MPAANSPLWMMSADCSADMWAAAVTRKIGARLATNIAITCCSPKGMPRQNDIGASREVSGEEPVVAVSESGVVGAGVLVVAASEFAGDVGSGSVLSDVVGLLTVATFRIISEHGCTDVGRSLLLSGTAGSVLFVVVRLRLLVIRARR